LPLTDRAFAVTLEQRRHALTDGREIVGGAERVRRQLVGRASVMPENGCAIVKARR
jgi:hypothetical protein